MMSEQISESPNKGQAHGARRRQQLRTLLLNAADTARQTRQTPLFSAQVPAQPVGLRIRDRIARLLNGSD
jgi:hypothetical protein